MHPTPRACGLLDVGDDQLLYWEEWGNPAGVPVLHVHGGPGGGLGQSGYRHRCDPTRMRIIGFEQRGCGRSLPHASDLEVSLATNTTPALVADMERLREHLGVAAWILNGVSWGSTLALAYAQAHPERVLCVVLFAVTTTSRWEVEWITQTVGALYPEGWDRFASFAEDAGVGFRRGRDRLVCAYAELLNSSDADLRDTASREWALWEDTHISIGTGGIRRSPRWQDDAYRLAFARLTTHYWSHDGFCDPPLLERMDRVAGIPAVLIHGRRDVSGPLRTAWSLHRAWPGSTLVVDEGEGHGGASMVDHWDRANALLLDGVHPL